MKSFFSTQKRIYLDYASATPVDATAASAMQKADRDFFGNGSAFHKEGVLAGAALRAARKSIADAFAVHPEEIIFTSGGTESDNLAIRGVIEVAKKIKKNIHIVTSEIEHSAVLETCKILEQEGILVTYVLPEKNGIVTVKAIKEAITPDTVLVSIMYANNEIGTIQPIHEIAKMIRSLKSEKENQKEGVYPIFHTDAAQAINYLPVVMTKLGVDMLSCNSTKIYGPKGVGVLIKKRTVPFAKQMHGGDQENGFRAGTENIPGIIGFAKALLKTISLQEKESARLKKLQDYFIQKIKILDANAILNGEGEKIPNIVNISFSGFSSELLVIELDALGIAVSSKSACKSESPEESHVIAALQSVHDMNSSGQGSIRFSFGRHTTQKDLDYTISSLEKIFKKYQKMKSSFVDL